MVYQNTGKARNKIITITKGDASQNYSITNSFMDPNNTGTRYSALADSEFARLTDAEYQDRLDAFCRYVYSLNDGLQSDCPNLKTGAEFYSLSCPVGGSNVLPEML